MRYAVPLLVFLAMSVFLALGLGQDPEYVPSPFIGKAVPPFTLESLDDPLQTVSTSDFKGKAFVINVWGSWCPACYDEHPYLLEYAQQGELPIVGLNWKDTREDARNWLARLGDPYVVNAYDPVGDAGINLGVYGAPESFLVSAEGVVLHKHVGPLTPAIWQAEFLSRVSAL
ncbi:MAG: DsbE family thiol:disulfide interchange protein [Pseudomonadota bacterium]